MDLEGFSSLERRELIFAGFFFPAGTYIFGSGSIRKIHITQHVWSVFIHVTTGHIGLLKQKKVFA